ncbi:extracellular solute-binding protein [Halobacillus mangrovi]|uniref:extracellular solute-binding protein n=1 Tax=Halobacillus mangrovi TaxID=402384 RepID=UPI003D96C9C1
MFGFFVIVLVSLVGCGPDESSTNPSESEESEKPEKLTIWEDIGKAKALEPAIESFEEEHGISVEVKEVEMSSEMKERIRLDGPAGTGPDVFTLPHDQIGQLATEGILQPLKFEDSVLNTFTKSSLASQTFKGEIYGLPKATETAVFIYNKDLMKEVPATSEELFQLSKEKRSDESYGFLAVWSNLYFGYSVIGGMGGYIFEETNGTLDPTQLGLNNEGAVEGAAYIRKWYEEGLFPKGLYGENGGSTMDSLFTEGKAAAVMAGPWAFQSYEDAGVNIGVAPLPKLPNENPMKTFIGVKGWHVSSFSKHTDWSQKLVEHLTNYENAKVRFKTTGEIPPVKELLEDPIIKDNEKANAVSVQSQSGVPMPNIPEMAEVWGPMGTALELITLGKSEPEEALDEAVDSIKSNIKANHSQD